VLPRFSGGCAKALAQARLETRRRVEVSSWIGRFFKLFSCSYFRPLAWMLVQYKLNCLN
jgi:hypothetical protein